MIVDTSALIAILSDEGDASIFAAALGRSHNSRISAGSFLEAAIVVDNRIGAVRGNRLDELLSVNAVTIEPVTERQAQLARQAYRDFGRGSGHAASLNFGDCFAYALAKDAGEPLLYKGNDFAHTDIRSALA